MFTALFIISEGTAYTKPSPRRKAWRKTKISPEGFFSVSDLNFSEQNILRLELIFFGNGADHLAGYCAAFPVRWERCGCTPSTVALHGSVPPWGVFIATDIGGRVFHNIQSVHRVCPFHTVFFKDYTTFSVGV